MAAQAVALLLLAQSTQQTERSVNRVSILYSSVAELATTLLQADVQARAYLLTHDPHNRDDYDGLRLAVHDQMAALYADSRPEPALAAQVPELDLLANRLLARLDAVVHRDATDAGTNDSEAFGIAQKRFADAASERRAQELAGLTKLWNVSAGVLAFAGAFGLLLTAGLAVIAQRHLALRIERVAQHASSYAAGTDVDQTQLVEGTDEIARLDSALQTMAETITERERELRLALGEAQAASEAKSTFVATMSHEIRTPLNGVIGMSELLLESPLTEPEREYAQTIHASGMLLLGIINDILDFSKISAGHLSLESKDIDLAAVAGEVIGLFAAQAKAKSLTISTAIESGVPDFVTGDELRLRQILINIVGNAVKFTAQGSISLTLSAHDLGEGRVAVTFDVADTGVGVPEAMRETIFQPFQQADMSKTRAIGGTGLGLSIARELATLMGGTIALRDGPGGGSLFSVSIPFARSPSKIDRPAEPPAPAPAPTLRMANVLLVEDNEINQRVATRLLQRLGLEPQIAANGVEALVALERSHYDLVLMDLQMPEMDGLEASIELRRREVVSGEHIPIIAMTANVLPEDRRAALSAGMNDYLAKPVTLAELQRVLQRWLPHQTVPLIAKQANGR